MAIKAVDVDDQNTQHLMIGLNRDNVNSSLDGDVFTLPQEVAITLTESSGVVLDRRENRLVLLPIRIDDAGMKPTRLGPHQSDGRGTLATLPPGNVTTPIEGRSSNCCAT